MTVSSRFVSAAVFVIALGSAACSGAPRNLEPSVFGTYAGAYSGMDSGSVLLEVGVAGDVKLSAKSSFWGTTSTGNGEVSMDGKAISGTGINFSFAGALHDGGASGTWSAWNGSATGTWTASHN